MILISHRGNLDGPKPERENHPDYVRAAWVAGYDVEVDVWFAGGRPVLGHDGPTYEVNEDFFVGDIYWCHAKDTNALVWLLENNIHCFWHQTDDMVLTSKGHIWTYPGKELTSGSIAVLPESVSEWDVSCCAGVCSDYVERHK